MLCPLLELVSLVTPKVSYQRQQNGASKVIIKVFPRGHAICLHAPPPPFDDFAACRIVPRRKFALTKCSVIKLSFSPTSLYNNNNNS